MHKDMNITLTFMSAWWNKHFYSIYDKPVEATIDEMDRVSLQRQRFLFENLGEYGIGDMHPLSDGKYVNVIMKWCIDFIPYLLGVNLHCLEGGFWQAEPLSEDEIKVLKPVDIAAEPFSEWVLGRKEMLEQRYGKAENGQLIEGSVNAATRIRGEEIYYDLVVNKELANHLLGVITETVIMAHKFYAREFGIEQVFLADCTNQHIGPELYEEMGLGNDIRIAEETRSLFDKDRYIYVHNCDSKADKFIDLYKKIPGLHTLDGSDSTDIKRVKSTMKGVRFNSFINPNALQQTPEQLHERISRVIAQGADDLLVANIDPTSKVSDIKRLLKIIAKCCGEVNINPVFEVTLFTEDEYDWSFPRYQGNVIYHCKDDWRQLIPKAGSAGILPAL